MKNLQEQLQQEIGQVTEARNYPYRVNIIVPGHPINVTITLDNPRDAEAMDKWLEDQLDNTILHAD